MSLDGSTAELKSSVREALLQDGEIRKMKAHLRERVLSILQNKQGSTGEKSLYATTPKLKEVKADRGERAGYAVVADYLKDRDLDFSLSLLKGESGMGEGDVELDIPEKALQRVVGQPGSLLSNIIKDWVKLSCEDLPAPTVVPEVVAAPQHLPVSVEAVAAVMGSPARSGSGSYSSDGEQDNNSGYGSSSSEASYIDQPGVVPQEEVGEKVEVEAEVSPAAPPSAPVQQPVDAQVVEASYDDALESYHTESDEDSDGF